MKTSFESDSPAYYGESFGMDEAVLALLVVVAVIFVPDQAFADEPARWYGGSKLGLYGAYVDGLPRADEAGRETAVPAVQAAIGMANLWRFHRFSAIENGLFLAGRGYERTPGNWLATTN